MSSPTPHFLLVHGGWLFPEIWTTVQGLLKDSGFPSTAVSLASVDADPPKYDMTEDVAVIRTAAERLADKGENIIVVLHSYSGQPGSDAMRGLRKADRVKQGRLGGVVRLVFVMAWVVPEGFQPAQRDDYSAAPAWMNIDREVI